MRADSETNFRKITKKISKKIFRGNYKEVPEIVCEINCIEDIFLTRRFMNDIYERHL